MNPPSRRSSGDVASFYSVLSSADAPIARAADVAEKPKPPAHTLRISKEQERRLPLARAQYVTLDGDEERRHENPPFAINPDIVHEEDYSRVTQNCAQKMSWLVGSDCIKCGLGIIRKTLNMASPSQQRGLFPRDCSEVSSGVRDSSGIVIEDLLKHADRASFGILRRTESIQAFLNRAAKESVVQMLVACFRTRKFNPMGEHIFCIVFWRREGSYQACSLGYTRVGWQSPDPIFRKLIRSAESARNIQEHLLLIAVCKVKLEMLTRIRQIHIVAPQSPRVHFRSAWGSNGSDGSYGSYSSDGSHGSHGSQGSHGSHGSDGSDGSGGSHGSHGGHGSDGSGGSEGSDESDGSDGSDGSNSS